MPLVLHGEELDDMVYGCVVNAACWWDSECRGSSVGSESGWGLLVDSEVSCGLLVLLGSTSRDSLGLLQLLGPVLLRSELLRLLVELGSGLRLWRRKSVPRGVVE